MSLPNDTPSVPPALEGPSSDSAMLPAVSNTIHTDSHAVDLQQSISAAIANAMGNVSSMISQSISQALRAQNTAPTQPVAVAPVTSRINCNDGLAPSKDNVHRSRKRACPRQAEKARPWKSARARPELSSDSEIESDEEVFSDGHYASDVDLEGVRVADELEGFSPPLHPPSSVGPDDNLPGSSSLIDPQGTPLFDPDSLHHPRSAEWLPIPHVAQYLESRVRKPLSKETRNKLKAECPRPLIPNKMIQFLSKSGFNPRKGLDSALRACQDKLLDSLGPMTKIFELAETARIEGTAIDPEELSGWAQGAICLLGNVNSSLSIERRKALLMKIEPKLSNMALTEAGKEAQGLLFGDSFIKDLGKFVGAFTALDKAQSSMRKVFHGRVSNRAGSFRGRLSGRVHFQTRGSARGPYNHRPSFQDQRQQSTFFPSRGQTFRSRGFRGNLGSRSPLGKSSKPMSFFQPLYRGQTPTFFTRLEPGNLRSVDTSHGPGFSYRSGGISPVAPRSSSTSTIRIGPILHGPRAPFPVGQRSNRGSASSLLRGGQQYVFGGEERGPIPAGNQLAESEQVCVLPPFQNGRDSLAQGPFASRRLDGEVGPERRLSDGPCVPSVQSAPSIPLARPSVAIHVSSIWPLVGPLVFHQVDAAGGGLASQAGNSSCDLPRRYPLHGPISRGIVNSPTGCDVSYYRSGIRYQRREVLPTSFQIDGIPGFCGELQRADPLPPWIQNQVHTQGTTTRPETSTDVAPSPGTHYRSSVLVHPGDLSGASSLSGVATTEDRASPGGCVLRRLGDSGPRDEGRTHVVDRQPRRVEWQGHRGSSAGSDRGVGCQSPRLGCILQWGFHRRALVRRRVPSPHKRSGVVSRFLRHPQLHQRQSVGLYQTQDGQCVGRALCQRHGGHPFINPNPSSEGFLVLLPGQRLYGDRGIYPRATQYFRELEFSSFFGLQRLEIRSSRFLLHQITVGTSLYGSLCFTLERPTSALLQLEAGSSVGGCRRPSAGLVGATGLRFSPICAHPEGVVSGPSPTRGLSTGSSLLASPILVPSAPGTSSGGPSSSSIISRASPRASGPTSPAGGGRLSSSTGVQNLRDHWGVANLSGTARALLENAWAPGTRRAYQSAWKRWSGWCVGRSLDPLSAPVTDILEFLTSLYEEGKAYRSINLFRSAISSQHQGFAGCPAGQHPLVCRLLKGSRLSRPPRPRFTSSWDVTLVLQFFSSWPLNSSLSLRQLSAKLVTLLCLVSCKRVSDVRALDFDALSFTPGGVLFNISRRTKTNIRAVSYPAFPDNQALCPVLCLKEYLSRTISLREPSNPQLFISFRRPFLPVASVTLSRWVKWILSLAGVDTSIFTAHSVRGASATSMTIAGARLEDVLRLADWSRASTFREFYFRPPPHAFSTVISTL
ncbi:uncharacterized protein LOC122928733 [Bufo gargarizans]|uniref:uncharacterized protein LOC122928733 n=1 Tax=Bufo gargarizans TaxID=30331 RepID=UPI001CF48938|nr:uncharacterized protein LOC122928733 [Bufo gargarizans]